MPFCYPQRLELVVLWRAEVFASNVWHWRVLCSLRMCLPSWLPYVHAMFLLKINREGIWKKHIYNNWVYLTQIVFKCSQSWFIPFCDWTAQTFPIQARRLLEDLHPHSEWDLMAAEEGDAGALPVEADVKGHRGVCSTSRRLPIIGKSEHRRWNKESEDKNNKSLTMNNR